MEQQVTMEQIHKLLAWHRSLDGRTPLLGLDDNDQPLRQGLEKMATFWFDDSEMTHPAAIGAFVRQLLDALRLIDSNNQKAILRRIRSEGGYTSTNTGGVSGKARYDADKSRVDGMLYKRGRR
jgi:hypothetical protein